MSLINLWSGNIDKSTKFLDDFKKEFHCIQLNSGLLTLLKSLQRNIRKIKESFTKFVIGTQSSGKSSLLENITRNQFS